MKKIKSKISIKIIMFISSYFPLYIMLLILYNKKIMSAFYTRDKYYIAFFVSIFILMLLSLFSIYLLKKANGSRYRKFNEIEKTDDMILSYMMTYLFPLLVGVDSSAEVKIVNILIFMLIGYIYIKMDLVYLNPLWSFFNFRIYKCDNETMLISDIPYNDLKRLNSVHGVYILNNVYIAKLKENKID